MLSLRVYDLSILSTAIVVAARRPTSISSKNMAERTFRATLINHINLSNSSDNFTSLDQQRSQIQILGHCSYSHQQSLLLLLLTRPSIQGSTASDFETFVIRMPPPTKSFSYTPLDRHKREIRLLVLLKRGWRSKILPADDFACNCRLEHATFSISKGIKSYEALSYTWGRPNRHFPPRFITLNGAKFEVGENLFHALRYMTFNSKDRVLWIDAICINQDDTSEKSHQVQQMGDIYRMASQVVVWLGLSTAETKGTFRFIKEHSPTYLKTLKGDAKYKWKMNAIVELKDLCERDYWSRVWIIQEIGLASKIQIVCGNYKFPWDSLSRVLDTMGPSMPVLVASLGWLQVRRQEYPITLQSLLLKFEASLCKVPHDKIYGFSGLACDWAEANIPIDYNKSLLRLHGDVLSFYSDRAFQSGSYSFSRTAQARQTFYFRRAQARPKPSKMECKEFYSNLLQLSWLIWNQLAASRPELVLAKQIFPSANGTARQGMSQQVSEAVKRTFIKVGVNDILPFWLFLLTKSELWWVSSCLQGVKCLELDLIEGGFGGFCSIKKYEFGLEFSIELIYSRQKPPLRTVWSARPGEKVNYHVFNKCEHTTQGALFWTTNFYLALDSKYESARYNDFERGWLCFRKHSKAAQVKHRRSKAGSVTGDLGFDRRKLDNWASSGSGIGYSLVLPRHQLKLCLPKEVFSMLCRRRTEGDFFSGQVKLTPHTYGAYQTICFDPRYRSTWRPCMNLHATAAIALLTISCIVGRPKDSTKTLLQILEVV